MEQNKELFQEEMSIYNSCTIIFLFYDVVGDRIMCKELLREEMVKCYTQWSSIPNEAHFSAMHAGVELQVSQVIVSAVAWCSAAVIEGPL